MSKEMTAKPQTKPETIDVLLQESGHERIERAQGQPRARPAQEVLVPHPEEPEDRPGSADQAQGQRHEPHKRDDALTHAKEELGGEHAGFHGQHQRQPLDPAPGQGRPG